MVAATSNVIVVAAEPTTDRLATVVTGLDASYAASVRATFEPMFVNLEKWERLAREISVTSEDQTGDMKLAHTLRMDIRKARVHADKTRKSAKENILLQGRAIDGAYAIFEAAVAPLEAYLLDQESYAERKQAARKNVLRRDREETLLAYGGDPSLFVSLGDMTDEQWATTKQGVVDAKHAREEAARQAEAVRIEAEKIVAEKARVAREEAAKVEAARIEQARIRDEENARLKREAAEREEATRAELAKAAKLLADTEAQAAAERAHAEAKARAEREAAAEETRKAQAEVKRLEAAQLKAASEAKAAADAEVARLEAEKAAMVAAEEAAKQAAELAPDREKLAAFATVLRGLVIPTLTTTRGKAAGVKVADQIAKMAAWVEKTGLAL